MISDHAMMHSGVAIQSRLLIEGLVNTGKYQVLQLGAAKYHDDMSPQKINNDFTIIPSNGFGNKEIIDRSLLVNSQTLWLFLQMLDFLITFLKWKTKSKKSVL